jgi:SAM-dependent methyltransferase
VQDRQGAEPGPEKPHRLASGFEGRQMTRTTDMAIPFYGAVNTRLFEIERRCMDRDGVVIDFLDRLLPAGRVLDVGAGNGFVSAQLMARGRPCVVALEPDSRMVDPSRPLVWSRGVAQEIPFHDATFDAAYATWAYFLAGGADREPGLREIVRVVRDGGPIVIVDNAGEDEFCALSSKPIVDDGQWYLQRGFSRTVLDTAFRFDSVEEARELLSFYFGEDTAQSIHTAQIEFKVAAYVGERGTLTADPRGKQ